jgi:hypothetical protein
MDTAKMTHEYGPDICTRSGSIVPAVKSRLHFCGMRLASVMIDMDKVIKTEFVNPPVSLRDYDWRAWFEGEEQRGQYGYGATEKEAIANLLEQYGPPRAA